MGWGQRQAQEASITAAFVLARWGWGQQQAQETSIMSISCLCFGPLGLGQAASTRNAHHEHQLRLLWPVWVWAGGKHKKRAIMSISFSCFGRLGLHQPRLFWLAWARPGRASTRSWPAPGHISRSSLCFSSSVVRKRLQPATLITKTSFYS